ncbi:hypothetical protein V2J09_008151 [Rumex salicifolius]
MGILRSNSHSSSSSVTSSSSSSSSSSCCFSSSGSSNSAPSARCEGLDLLVKAIYCVASGSTVAVPYIQRRVIRRRKPAIRFSQLIITESKKRGEAESKNGEIELNFEGLRRMKTRRAKLALPSKYNDSVLHEWKPPRCIRRRSGSGFCIAFGLGISDEGGLIDKLIHQFLQQEHDFVGFDSVDPED